MATMQKGEQNKKKINALIINMIRERLAGSKLGLAISQSYNHGDSSSESVVFIRKDEKVMEFFSYSEEGDQKEEFFNLTGMHTAALMDFATTDSCELENASDLNIGLNEDEEGYKEAMNKIVSWLEYPALKMGIKTKPKKTGGLKL